MKKILLSVALIIAAISNAKCEEVSKENNVCDEEIERILNAVNFTAEHRQTAHVVKFYDVDRIKINNDTHGAIRIYDSSWKLVLDTTENVDTMLEDGDYYVVSNLNIIQKYIDTIYEK